MSKKHFRTLLKRYQDDDCTPQERRLVEQWFALIDGEPPRRTDSENRQLEDRIWRAIQKKGETVVPTTRPAPSGQGWWMAAAAVVLLGLGWFAYEAMVKNAPPSSASGTSAKLSADFVQRSNTTTANLEIALSDGSRVTLAPHSSLEYPAVFGGGRREVTLIGEALFQVTRNPEQPFFVNAGEVTTKVLGTSFRIETGDDNHVVKVSVLTGKVSVFQRDSPDGPAQDKIKNGVILTPNQRVVYSQANRSFETSLVEQPMVVNPDDSPSATGSAHVSFTFEDATVATVVGKLEKAYGIEIILENEELGECLFTAAMTEQPLFTKLDLLCSSLNATYEVRGTKILIMGKGCR